MGNFIIPDGPVPQPVPPPPPLNPRVAREEKIADDTRVESELNRFIASKQDALFNNPDAFFRTQGKEAIHAAPVATKDLEQIRDDLLDSLANDYQRKRLGAALDAQMTVARDDIARHVAEQSLVWQRQVALDRIDLLAKEAAFRHTDDGLIDVLGTAAASAARAHACVGVDSPNPQIEDRAATLARSRVLSAAMQARLAAANVDTAGQLVDQTRADPAAVPHDVQVAGRPENAYAECTAECSQKYAMGELPRPKWFTGSDPFTLMRLCIRACLAEKGDLNYLLPSSKENGNET